MPELRFRDQIYTVDDYDTVLNTLIKNGHAVPNFCRSGYCHSCMMKCEEGTPLPTAQAGLSEELVDENHFLACQCAVFMPMTVVPPEKEKRTRFTAMVRGKKKLSDQVVSIQLHPGHAFRYKAGQYTTLTNIDGFSADYGIASAHDEGNYMTFHIPDNKDNPLNQTIFHELEEGDGLEIQTALGDHFYRPAYQDEPLVLIAEDEGLGPVYALMEDALQQGHQGEIYLAILSNKLNVDYAESVIENANEKVNVTILPVKDALDGEDLTTWLPIALKTNPGHCFISGQNEQQLKEMVLNAGLDIRQIYLLSPA